MFDRRNNRFSFILSKYYTTTREVNQNVIQIGNESAITLESQYLETSPLATSTRRIEKEDNDMQIREMVTSNVVSMNGIEEIRDVAHVHNYESNPLIDRENRHVGQTTTLGIVNKIWLWISSVFITYVVCLSIFPSIV